MVVVVITVITLIKGADELLVALGVQRGDVVGGPPSSRGGQQMFQESPSSCLDEHVGHHIEGRQHMGRRQVLHLSRTLTRLRVCRAVVYESEERNTHRSDEEEEEVEEEEEEEGYTNLV